MQYIVLPWVVSPILLRLYDLLLKRYGSPCAHHEGIWGQKRYSSTHCQPQHEMEVSGQFHTLATLFLFACMNLNSRVSCQAEEVKYMTWCYSDYRLVSKSMLWHGSDSLYMTAVSSLSLNHGSPCHHTLYCVHSHLMLRQTCWLSSRQHPYSIVWRNIFM
jgi:hypothetical protein